MIIFIYGEDTFRSRQKLSEIIEEYKKKSKSGLSLKSFDGQELDFQSLKEEIRQASMFEENKLLILRNPISNQKLKEDILEAAKELLSSKDVFLFYQEGQIRKNDKLLSLIKKQGKVQEFSPLDGQNLRNWYKKEFGRYRAEISTEALNRLVEFVGDDLWRASLEVQKLFNFKKGKRIDREDVELLVKPKLETDIFKTIDAIAKKDKKTALTLIHKHLEKGDHPLYLLTMINYQFRNLLLVKDLIEKREPYSAILRKSQLHPFVVRKSLAQARSFSLPELKKIYQKIFQADLSIKTGKTEAKAALDILIVSF